MDFDKDPSTLGFQMQDDDEPHERGVLKTGTPRVICAKPMRRGEALVEELEDDNDTNSISRLMDLPAELRNRIFRFALLQDRMIILSATSPSPPALLAVCCQIRSETIHVYYTENKFVLRFDDYNAESIKTRYHVQVKYFKPKGDQTQGRTLDCGMVGMLLQGRPNWRNFVRWCELLHYSQMPRLVVDATCTDQTLICIAAIHGAVKKLNGLPWGKVEDVLKSLRPVLVLRDAVWAT